MKLVPPYVAWNQAACPQGEPLTWLGYEGRAGEHWFGVGAEPELCRCCWEAPRCPRQFAHQPAEHETLLGRLPLASGAVRMMLLSEELDLVRVTVKCSACGYEEQHTVKGKEVADFEKGLIGKPCAACKAPSFTIADKKDVVDDLAELAELANTDVEVISGETEEGQMLKNAFGGIAAILRFKMQG